MTGPAAPHVPGVLEAALYAEDLDAAEWFYGEVLGLERIARDGARHVFYRAGLSVVLIFNPVETAKPGTSGDFPIPPHGATGPGHLCLMADAAALEAWRSRLEAAGIAIESDFHWRSGARSIYVRDPAGNSVEFAEPRLWAA